MTAAPGPSPQQIRDRLLEAIDRHSNIHNMVAVLEVISSLEKYPITKEALEETRLGKLINDVRKKTKNEDLAKRAKKLLRNWQKLIEPVTPGEGALRGLPSAPGSANGGAHHCRLEAPPAAAAAGPKPVQDVKSRNDIQKIHSPKPGNRKRKGGEPRESVLPPPPPKAPKVSYEGLPNSSSSTPPTNGIGGSPESFPSPPDGSFSSGPEPGESDKPSKIPINAVRPHTSSPGLFKASSGPPSLLKAAGVVLQEKAEETAAGQPRSPRCSSFSPRPGGLEGFARQHAPYAAKGRAPARSPRPPLPEAPGARPLLSPLPASSTLPVPKRSEGPQPPEGPPRGSESPAAAPEGQLRLGPAAAAPAGSPPAEPSSLPGAGVSPGLDSDGGAASGSEGKKKKKKHLHQHLHQHHHRPQDYVLHLDGQAPEGAGVKPVRLKKERRLTFDPMTGEIKPLAQRDALAAADLPALAEPPRTGPGPLGEAKAPLHSPFEQTNWKELSRNEIIQSYLTRQSSLLSSSGAQTPGAHYFMSEYLKQEESTRREARKTHVLAPHAKPSELPGVTREVTGEDLGRLGGRPWPGVNGCYDTQGNWYDWTQGISLDPHGDSGHLNILPYVCLD